MFCPSLPPITLLLPEVKYLPLNIPTMVHDKFYHKYWLIIQHLISIKFHLPILTASQNLSIYFYRDFLVAFVFTSLPLKTLEIDLLVGVS